MRDELICGTEGFGSNNRDSTGRANSALAFVQEVKPDGARNHANCTVCEGVVFCGATLLIE
jgi:hypothetical protein